MATWYSAIIDNRRSVSCRGGQVVTRNGVFRSRSSIGSPLVESMSNALLRTCVRTRRPVQVGVPPSLRSARSRHHLARSRKRDVRLLMAGPSARTGTHCGWDQRNKDRFRFQRSIQRCIPNQQLSARQGMSALAHSEVLP